MKTTIASHAHCLPGMCRVGCSEGCGTESKVRCQARESREGYRCQKEYREKYKTGDGYEKIHMVILKGLVIIVREERIRRCG